MTNETRIWYWDAAAGLAKFRQRCSVFTSICERHDVIVKAPMVFDIASVKSKGEKQREAFLYELFFTFCCPPGT